MTTLLADPCIAAIPVHDDNEHLVDLATRGIDCIAASGAHPSRWVRAGVADRLEQAASALPSGIRLLVFEGFRTAAAQQAIVAAYSASVREHWPDLDHDQLSLLTSRYVAPLGVAPHVAGAAIDLTLVRPDGRRLDMGTEIDATPEESGNACFFNARNIDASARAHRTLLAAAMSAGGFVNYPTEWWHWSFGDRYWAHVTGAPAALYGPIITETAPIDGTGLSAWDRS
jgi:D-alanyl-D-alanine dipeptidase